MCSYVNVWYINNKLFNNIKIIIENIFIYMIYFAIYIKTIVPQEFEETIIYKLLGPLAC